MPSSFARRTARKPHRVIDACILIASLAERDESCARYLSGLGYQHHGHITHPLIGEVVNGSCRHVRDLFLRRKVFEYLEEMLVRNRISVLPYKTIRSEHLSNLRRALPHLTEDDSLHLAELELHGLAEFVTVDEELTRNRERLAQLGIRIVNPRGTTPEHPQG